MKPTTLLRAAVTAWLVTFTAIANAATGDAEWKAVAEAIDALKNPKEKPKSRDEAIATATKKLQTFDEAYEAAMKVSQDNATRWSAAVANANLEKLREIIKAKPDENLQAELEAAVKAANIGSEDKEDAERFLKKLQAAAALKSKPLDLKFTAVDGREVDLSKMRGKVVLIDFWATWCGPCVAELPNVKKAYKDLNPKGFEIIGISLDSDKAELEAFVKKEEMGWPQYFDGKGWKNDISSLHGINSIPAMWLVNKEGMVVDTNARDGLAEKVATLLK
ncbi:MAG: TlpA family protein disulfide reductase [Verrucomicrobiaceae bacterium]|nr:TlpA family protein disulfide reductase [Verrucomicrobiaceae bacterium]